MPGTAQTKINDLLLSVNHSGSQVGLSAHLVSQGLHHTAGTPHSYSPQVQEQAGFDGIYLDKAVSATTKT